MRYATVCSGVEAMSLAVAGMGWKPIFFSEIEPFPCAVLSHRFPDVPNLGDMARIDGGEWRGAVDVLAGGTPCQSFSVAGNRMGLDDERGSLMLHFARLAHEIKPKWLLWENVPGCLSSSGGHDFAALLSSLCGWDVPVPKGGWRNCGIVTNHGNDTYGISWRTIDAQFCRVDRFARAVPQRRRRVWLVGHIGDWRRAAEILLVGEGVSGHPPPREGKGEGAAAGTGGGSGGAGQACMTFEPGVASRVGGHAYNGISGTLRADAGDNRMAVLCVHGSQDPCVALDLANGVGTNGGLENVVFDHAHAKKIEVGMTVTGDHECLITDTTHLVKCRDLVRRLTPTECERLMGFPDGWTRIPWRGRPAEECPDGPRYKACGNSWAVNCARWVMKRIELAESLRIV